MVIRSYLQEWMVGGGKGYDIFDRVVVCKSLGVQVIISKVQSWEVKEWRDGVGELVKNRFQVFL